MVRGNRWSIACAGAPPRARLPVANVGRYGVVRASDDAIRTLAWVFGHAGDIGADREQVVVTGESGAQLAAGGIHGSRSRALRRQLLRADRPDRLRPCRPTIRSRGIDAVLRSLSPLALVRPDVCPVSIQDGRSTRAARPHLALTQRLREAG
jgi:acetyl esterase/lipase